MAISLDQREWINAIIEQFDYEEYLLEQELPMIYARPTIKLTGTEEELKEIRRKRDNARRQTSKIISGYLKLYGKNQ